MSTSRIARRGLLQGAVAGAACACTRFVPLRAQSASGSYACPPCGCAADGEEFDGPGRCPACGMTLEPAEIAIAVTVEEVVFESRGVQLSGELLAPEDSPYRAGIVLVHGSGPTERMSGWARVLASNGFVTLTYDKRGVGASGGVYEGENNVSSSNLDLLAADATAAHRTLRAHDKATGVPVGYAGVSQAGWIIPLAAKRSSDVAFMVLWSAPVTKVSEELRFSADSAKDEEAAQAARNYAQRIRNDDTDPRDSLELLDIPGVWLFGDGDASIPVPTSIERLSELIADGHDFEYQVFSGYGHNIGSLDADPRINAAIDWINDSFSSFK